MALLNFDRTYELVVEDPLDITPPTEGLPTIKNEGTETVNSEDLSQITVNALTISDLHFDATISSNSKTSGTDGTEADIRVYNLNEENRRKLSRINSPVILSAGYNGENKNVFVGQVYKSLSFKEGTNVITQLLCKTGWTPLTGIRYTKSASRGQSYEDIFRDIIEIFKKNGIQPLSAIKFTTAVGNLEAPSTARLVKSWSFTGFLRQALDELCKEFRYKWQIVNSKLWIYPETEQDYVEEIIYSEGNILSIRPVDDGTNSNATINQNNAKTEKIPTKGFDMKVLLEGAIDETKRIRIEAEEGSTLEPYIGSYKVENYRHSLSYEGANWYTTVRCVKLEQSESNDESV